ncbi:MAG: 4Fe-4S binding protein [Candidatus Thermoplasmatota archaeon]|jgi:polyferredoxin|nr:4Fe-4S binding protein [Candidatus Thermoplasmatota archaeon]
MKFQIKRLLFQVLVTISANLGSLGLKTGFCFPFFYCNACPAATSACPLRSIEKSVYKGNFAWNLLIYPLLIIGFFGSITGRAICAWACPIGLLQRGTGNVARKLKKYPIIKKISKFKAEHCLRYTKYFILLGLVVLTTALFGFMFTDICPVGFLTGTIPTLILNPGKFVLGFYFWPAFVIFILFLILIFAVERGWCRYFCPVGAILGTFNKISLLHVDVDKTNCIGCNVCSFNCPMSIDVPNMVRDPECILCGKCMDVCPKKIISYKWL